MDLHSVNEGFCKDSTRKACHWRGRGHSVNRWTSNIKIFCAHPPLKSQWIGLSTFVKWRPKSAQQLRDSTVAARRAQSESVTVPPSQVTRECRLPRLRFSPFKNAKNARFWLFLTLLGLFGSGRLFFWSFQDFGPMAGFALTKCIVYRKCGSATMKDVETEFTWTLVDDIRKRVREVDHANPFELERGFANLQSPQGSRAWFSVVWFAETLSTFVLLLTFLLVTMGVHKSWKLTTALGRGQHRWPTQLHSVARLWHPQV